MGRVIGRTVAALMVILVPMLAVENYFIYAGLAQLWWILAGLLMSTPAIDRQGLL